MGKLDAAQKRGWQFVVNFYGKHTGRNQFDVARFLAVVYGAAMVPGLMDAETLAEAFATSLLALLASIATVFMFWNANVTERTTERGFRGVHYVIRDIFASRFNRGLNSGIFFLNVFLCLITWRLRPIDFSYFAMWGYWYVIICDPPPQPRERESVDNMSRSGA
jgi:hypothetical protein